MAVGFPTKVSYADGDVFSASDINDTNGTINLIKPTAKGDLFAGSAANTYTKLAVGANDTVLTADSTAATGLKWAAVNAGGMTLLSTTTLSGATTTISSINQTYKDLLIFIQNPYVTVAAQLRINPNGNGSACSLSQVSNGTAGTNTNLATVSNLPTATGNASYYYLISNYSDTTYFKPVISYGSATSATSTSVTMSGNIGLTGAISSLDISTFGATSNFSGGRILVYGVK